MRFAEFLKEQNVIRPRHLIKKPIVSVIMPTYCRAHDGLLSQAITGVLMQTFSDFEFIIVDDGSIDGSENIIRDFQRQDNRILYVRHEINSGLPALRVDEGILLSKGDYIAFQFDDDNWAPSFLKNVTREAIKRNKGFVHCRAKYLLGSDIFSSSFPIMQPTHASLMQSNTIANASVLLRKSIFKNTGLYDPHLVLRRITDWDLWTRIAKQEAPYLLPEVLVSVQGGLPDAIGVKVPWIEYENFAPLFHVYRDIALTPERIMDFDVISLNKFYDKLPRDIIDRFYSNHVVSWLKQHKEQFMKFGIAIHDLKTLNTKMHYRRLDASEKNKIKMVVHKVSRFNEIIRKIMKRLFQQFALLSKFFCLPFHALYFMAAYWRLYFHGTWNSLPSGFAELENDPLMIKYRREGFLLKKSTNLQHRNSILYPFTVQGGCLYTLSLAFLRHDNGIYGSVGVEAVSLENKSLTHAITSVLNVFEKKPTAFFFDPPLKPGKYNLRIFGNHLKAPIYVYELYTVKGLKIVKQPFCSFILV